MRIVPEKVIAIMRYQRRQFEARRMQKAELDVSDGVDVEKRIRRAIDAVVSARKIPTDVHTTSPDNVVEFVDTRNITSTDK